MIPTPPFEVACDGRHDFDFIRGHWAVENRRLRLRLQGCEDWVTFPAQVENQPLLGGLGNLEQYRAVLPDGSPFQGLALRLFDPEARVWRIHWADDRRGHLDPALVGTFEGGRGTFFADDRSEGRPIRVRFLWFPESVDEARWEQAFSEDGGRTWETNWIMTFRRVAS
ncbi:MAG TPA: hypothetical protein VJ570_02105 [Holophagaceae bacterium]|nr:hypothetical protein [Holophagaceae bacterium]